MFALGVILQLLFFRNPCFKDADLKKDKNFRELIYNQKLEGQLNTVKVSDEFKNTVIGLLNYDSDARTSLKQLNKNPWLNNFTNSD